MDEKRIGVDRTIKLSPNQLQLLLSYGNALMPSEMPERPGNSDASTQLLKQGLIDDSGRITDRGGCLLAPYRVQNAIILAAGAATRFAPLSFEKPKAMFEVRGEVLIERLIRQLKTRGVDNIIVVVGYMKEAFFYLHDKFGVSIVVNPDYATRGNHSSLYAVRHLLGNSYICSSDQYYVDNVFRSYECESYCSAVSDCERARPWQYALSIDDDGRIVSVHDKKRCGLGQVWGMQGPAYFDQNFANSFVALLETQYETIGICSKHWDGFYADNYASLPAMHVKKLPDDSLYEFNFVEDLCAFDQDFFANVDSGILDNICSTLDCERYEIQEITPVKAGLTNLSVLFTCRNERYVYRHPGAGSSELVNRSAEAHALKIAKKLGIDETCVYANVEGGWKISRYIDGCVPFDYSNQDHVRRALTLAKRLHQSEETSPWSFDFYDEAMGIKAMLQKDNYPIPRDFGAVSNVISQLVSHVRCDDVKPCLCHNDLYGPNFLVKDDEMYLIDWEYSAMGDYAYDIGNFIAQDSGYSIDEALAVLSVYFEREPSPSEVRHCMACTAIVAFYWYVWAMYKESKGNAMGEWLYKWYKSCRQFGGYALELYAQDSGTEKVD